MSQNNFIRVHIRISGRKILRSGIPPGNRICLTLHRGRIKIRLDVAGQFCSEIGRALAWAVEMLFVVLLMGIAGSALADPPHKTVALGHLREIPAWVISPMSKLFDFPHAKADSLVSPARRRRAAAPVLHPAAETKLGLPGHAGSPLKTGAVVEHKTGKKRRSAPGKHHGKSRRSARVHRRHHIVKRAERSASNGGLDHGNFLKAGDSDGLMGVGPRRSRYDYEGDLLPHGVDASAAAASVQRKDLGKAASGEHKTIRSVEAGDSEAKPTRKARGQSEKNRNPRKGKSKGSKDEDGPAKSGKAGRKKVVDRGASYLGGRDDVKEDSAPKISSKDEKSAEDTADVGEGNGKGNARRNRGARKGSRRPRKRSVPSKLVLGPKTKKRRGHAGHPPL